MDPFELRSLKLKFRTAMEAAVSAVSRESSYWLANGGGTPTMQLPAFKHFLKQLSISKEVRPTRSARARGGWLTSDGIPRTLASDAPPPVPAARSRSTTTTTSRCGSSMLSTKTATARSRWRSSTAASRRPTAASCGCGYGGRGPSAMTRCGQGPVTADFCRRLLSAGVLPQCGLPPTRSEAPALTRRAPTRAPPRAPNRCTEPCADPCTDPCTEPAGSEARAERPHDLRAA